MSGYETSGQETPEFGDDEEQAEIQQPQMEGDNIQEQADAEDPRM